MFNNKQHFYKKYKHTKESVNSPDISFPYLFTHEINLHNSMPVLESHWIMKSGFSGEKDARAWTVRNCPSWRCDRDGRCRPGVAAKRERPLNFLPILPEEGFRFKDRG